jgi:hypothetical protein
MMYDTCDRGKAARAACCMCGLMVCCCASLGAAAVITPVISEFSASAGMCLVGETLGASLPPATVAGMLTFCCIAENSTCCPDADPATRAVKMGLASAMMCVLCVPAVSAIGGVACVPGGSAIGGGMLTPTCVASLTAVKIASASTGVGAVAGGIAGAVAAGLTTLFSKFCVGPSPEDARLAAQTPANYSGMGHNNTPPVQPAPMGSQP